MIVDDEIMAFETAFDKSGNIIPLPELKGYPVEKIIENLTNEL